mmetsp:Transcript_2215/g.7193  ORF Transcript_2215/g.7193 Transcript_2215/m.7193 type:complete len:267 (-) Transcript_2215:5448-6248(-)
MPKSPLRRSRAASRKASRGAGSHRESGSSRERSRGRIACRRRRSPPAAARTAARTSALPSPPTCASSQSSRVISSVPASLNVMRCAWPATRFRIRVVWLSTFFVSWSMMPKRMGRVSSGMSLQNHEGSTWASLSIFFQPLGLGSFSPWCHRRSPRKFSRRSSSRVASWPSSHMPESWSTSRTLRPVGTSKVSPSDSRSKPIASGSAPTAGTSPSSAPIWSFSLLKISRVRTLDEGATRTGMKSSCSAAASAGHSARARRTSFASTT